MQHQGWDKIMDGHMRSSTHAAIRLTGRLLAEDVGRWARWPQNQVVAAGHLLHAIDELDTVENEEHDRRISELAVADPRIWLEIAESGDLDGKHYIPHVLYHFGLGGHQPGEAWVSDLLRMIAAMPEEKRLLEATCHPEYVGLFRVVTELADGGARLLAVVDRW